MPPIPVSACFGQVASHSFFHVRADIQAEVVVDSVNSGNGIEHEVSVLKVKNLICSPRFAHRHGAVKEYLEDVETLPTHIIYVNPVTAHLPPGQDQTAKRGNNSQRVSMGLDDTCIRKDSEK